MSKIELVPSVLVAKTKQLNFKYWN